MSSKRNVLKAAVAAGLTVALTSGIALASIGTGTVTASSLRLRSEATMLSATLAYAPRSAQVTVLSAVSDDWYKVTFDGVEGYMSAQWLDVDRSGSDSNGGLLPDSSEDAAPGGEVETRQAVITDGPLNVRADAGTSYDKVGTLQRGDLVTVVGQEADGWYQITSGDLQGYVSAEYVSFDLDSVEGEPYQPREAVVTDGPLNVRDGAGTSYNKVGSLQRGDLITVVGETGDGWYQITNGDLQGYVSAEYVSFDLDSVEQEPQQGMVTTSVLNVRAEPTTDSQRIGTLKRGSTVTITGETGDGWYRIAYGDADGYVSAQYVTILNGSGSSNSSVGASAAALAYSLVGSPYAYGAEGPYSFDCSGLLYYIYRQLGYSIARGSSSQYNQSGYFVSAAEIQPGDLVFFFDPRFDGSGGTLPTTHAGIYVGGNQFIHASTTSYRVQYDPPYGGYYEPYIVGFKRIA